MFSYVKPTYLVIGKLYAMDFAEASTKCAARGGTRCSCVYLDTTLKCMYVCMYVVGHIAKVDTMSELTALYDLFVNDDELSVGLRDIGGQQWRWVRER